MCKEDLALNNQQWLICNKNKLNQTNLRILRTGTSPPNEEMCHNIDTPADDRFDVCIRFNL